MSQGKAPGGWVMKMSPDGKDREILNMGYRNPCDFALNRDGELFVYDADMEWDIGAPWYRPTRINHGCPVEKVGGEQLPKNGENISDTVGSVVDIGSRLSTGVIAGTNAKFPLIIEMPCSYVIGLCHHVFHPSNQRLVHIGEKRSSFKWRGPSIDRCGYRFRRKHVFLCRWTGGNPTFTEFSKATLRLSCPNSIQPASMRKPGQRRMNRSGQNALAVGKSAFLSNEDYHIRYAARLALEWQDPKVGQSTYPKKTI